MPTEPAPVTVAEVVRKAVEVCSDGVDDEALDEVALRFEDDDRPIAAIEDIESLLAERIGSPEVQDTGPALAMARAIIVYLAYRRDEVSEDPLELLRLAARAEFDGHPPAEVQEWLSNRGVEVR